MITAKINVTAIEKARLFKGEKGTYLDIVLIETPDDKYGNDYVVVQGVSKEERLSGVKGKILGNAKSWGPKVPAPARAPAVKEIEKVPIAKTENLDEDVPF